MGGDSFAELFGGRFLQPQEQDEAVQPDTQLAGLKVLAELDRERQAYQQQLQAQSLLRFHLGQWIRVLAWRLDQLARWVSP